MIVPVSGSHEKSRPVLSNVKASTQVSAWSVTFLYALSRVVLLFCTHWAKSCYFFVRGEMCTSLLFFVCTKPLSSFLYALSHVLLSFVYKLSHVLISFLCMHWAVYFPFLYSLSRVPPLKFSLIGTYFQNGMPNQKDRRGESNIPRFSCKSKHLL